MLGGSSINPRNKRALSSYHSSKLSVKDLALELAKKHVSQTKMHYLNRVLFERRLQLVSLKPELWQPISLSKKKAQGKIIGLQRLGTD